MEKVKTDILSMKDTIIADASANLQDKLTKHEAVVLNFELSCKARSDELENKRAQLLQKELELQGSIGKEKLALERQSYDLVLLKQEIEMQRSKIQEQESENKKVRIKARD